MKTTLLFLSSVILATVMGWSQMTYTPKNSIERTAYNMMSEGVLKNAAFSFRVVEISTDSVLAEYNPNMSLTPASTMKLVSTAAAMVNLGAYKRFETKVQYDGYIDTNGVLHGNIYIKGGGDPTLGSKYFTGKDEEPTDFFKTWVQEVKKIGIDSITGRVIADATIFSQEMIPATWVWGDMGQYYGAGPSGLTIYDNLLEVAFNSGENDGDPTEVACITPFLPYVHFDNRVKASKVQKDQAYIFAAPYIPSKLVKGTIPKNEENFIVKGTIHDPAYQAAYDFEYFLLKDSIGIAQNATTVRRLALSGDTVTQKRVDIYTHQSPSLSRIAYWTNHVSVNLFAEHLLNQVGVRRYGDGSNYSGALAVENYWKSKIGAGMYVADGSGLSRHNAVSAYHLTEILQYMRKSKYSKSFYSSLPIAGKSGTMRSIGKGTAAAGNIRAKSGTMSRVKSYAGYCTTKSGKKVAFAMIINNFNCYSSTVKKKLEKLMVAIANYNG